jgi:NAD(P)-dependent dehydrogenase (short-subunit alcohol dehydrogenase family)
MATSVDIKDIFEVKGLVAVVTGGGTGNYAESQIGVMTAFAYTDNAGIGLMMAQALEANGAIVYIIGRRKEVLDNAASTAVLPHLMKTLVQHCG